MGLKQESVVGRSGFQRDKAAEEMEVGKAGARKPGQEVM